MIKESNGLTEPMTELADKLVDLLVCNGDRLCKPANVTMGGTPSPIWHSYKCPASLRRGVVEYIMRQAVAKDHQ